MDFFFGAGYNGYPIGALYGNLPRHGRAVRSYPAKKSALIHAEANALLFRFKNIGDKDILYCSKLPCSDCQKYIEFVGIKKIVSTEKCCYITHNKWNQVSDRSAVYALQAGSNDQGANNSVPKGDVEGKAVSSCRLEKSEMCLFLAIHMENSPYCESPKGTVGPGSSTFKFCKTGIVICEGDKFQRIIAMDCSSKSLHAVQKVLLRLPNELRGCNVYLSRKPCIDCVKFLVQAQVRNIFFWPSLEIDTNTIKANKETFENQSKLIGNILKESCTYDAMFVPLVDGQSETKGAPISSIFECPELKTILDASSMSFLNEKEYQSAYKEEVKKAQNYIQMLTGNKNKKLLENNFHEILECEEEEEYIQHALQLCKFLAARSDASDKVGTVIYKGKNIVAVGYNGFPRGTMNNLFVNKDDGSLDQSRIVCAEANALILRPDDTLGGAELITLKKPCINCVRLIEEKGLKRIIWPKSESQL